MTNSKKKIKKDTSESNSDGVELKRLQKECDVLLEAKKIISDYYSDYSPGSNAPKLDKYISEIGDDMNNPFFMMKNEQKTAIHVLDMLFVIKHCHVWRVR